MTFVSIRRFRLPGAVLGLAALPSVLGAHTPAPVSPPAAATAPVAVPPAPAAPVAVPPAVVPPRCGAFTVAAIPDTQNYTDFRYQKAAGFPIAGEEVFLDQMRYLVRNARSRGGDIVFATHLGDVWQHFGRRMDEGHVARGFGRVPNGGSPTARNIYPRELRTTEVPNGVRGFDILNGAMPFSVVPGNHDLDALWTDPSHPPATGADGKEDLGLRHFGGLTKFTAVFSPRSRYFHGRNWYVAAHDDGADSAQIFTAGACSFLHIGLQYEAPDASLAWAQGVIDAHPGLPTIVTTHKYMNRTDRRAPTRGGNAELDPIDNGPDAIWDKLIRRNDQIFLVLSGHIAGQGYRVDRNDAGHAVYQLLMDYQERRHVTETLRPDKPTPFGDGWLRLFRFDLDGPRPRVHVRTYSTYYRAFSTDLADYAAWYKAADGQAALSDADFARRDDFVIDLSDYAGRFAAPVRAEEASPVDPSVGHR